MISIFNEYKDKGKITEALLIGRNMVNKKPGDTECVNVYLELLFNLAENLPSLDERKQFANQAGIVISFYEENVDLSDDIIVKIGEYRDKLNEILSQINKIENEKAISLQNQINDENTNQISQLYKIKDKLSMAKNRDEFDNALKELSIVDAKIQHDYMTEEQRGYYGKINDSCTRCISEKMRELEYAENLEYNKKAVEAYDSAFKKFKNDESRYRHQGNLNSLVSSTLFAYDAGRLFNETLIFYNHIYSYIFSKLDDEGKFALTKFSVQCERKLR